MTRDEIITKWDGMAPRERDAWVAEVVFGQDNACDRIGGCLKEMFGEECRCKCDEPRPCPHYTTDISAAWAVFEKLRENWLPGLQDCAVFGYRVDLQSDSECRADVGGVIAPTAPEAICLAAIIAETLTKEDAV